jgi:MerR family transcriptional regulator/heat shock protein HspR
MTRRKKGAYSISVVAEMFGIHQQTIRLYEKEGLIRPHRSSGNTRQFTEEDIDRLEEIISLTHKLGVNLAGVNEILKLQKKIKKLQSQVNSIFEKTNEELEEDSALLKKNAQSSAQRLLNIKQSTTVLTDEKSDSGEAIIVDDWEIDYEDDE